jgi:cell division protein FtsB
MLIGLFFLVVASAWAVWGVFKKDRESSALRAQAEAHLKDLTDRQAHLTASIGALETDRGREEALRDAYAVGKQGEGLIIIVDQTPTTTPKENTSPLDWLKRAFSWW